MRHEPEAADHARAFDSFEFRWRLAGRHECFAFRLPFTGELLQESVFFNRPWHFLAGRICGGWFFCSSAHIISFFLLVLADVFQFKEMTNGPSRAGHRLPIFWSNELAIALALDVGWTKELLIPFRRSHRIPRRSRDIPCWNGRSGRFLGNGTGYTQTQRSSAKQPKKRNSGLTKAKFAVCCSEGLPTAVRRTHRRSDMSFAWRSLGRDPRNTSLPSLSGVAREFAS